MTPQDALAAALAARFWAVYPEGADFGPDADAILAALTEAGMVIVRGNVFLDIAREAGADVSDLTDYRQLVEPELTKYAIREVRALRAAYDECLKETP